MNFPTEHNWKTVLSIARYLREFKPNDLNPPFLGFRCTEHATSHSKPLFPPNQPVTIRNPNRHNPLRRLPKNEPRPQPLPRLSRKRRRLPRVVGRTRRHASCSSNLTQCHRLFARPRCLHRATACSNASRWWNRRLRFRTRHCRPTVSASSIAAVVGF